MVLYKLDTGVVVGSIELVRDVPAKRPKLPTLLDDSVEETDPVQQRPPLRHVRDVKIVLSYACISPLQSSFDSFRWLVCKFNGDLEKQMILG